MQLQLHQLFQHLKGGLLPVYFITSDVLLLRQEARDNIRQAAQIAGFQNYHRLTVEPGFHWDELPQLANNFSLFAEKTLIELHNPDAKFDQEAGKILQAYCDNPPTDKLLLMVSGKLSGPQSKSRWRQSIDQCGAIITIWPIKPAEFPDWIKRRMALAGIKADANSIRLLADLTEGNLLAAQQAMTKLRLLYPNQPIEVDQVAAAISDNAQFNLFELSQHLLTNNRPGIIRVLDHLQATDHEPILVLWLLARECRELLNMLEQIEQGKSLPTVLAGHWANLRPLYQKALSQAHSKQLKKILLKCQEADQIIKGVSPGNAWNALAEISLNFISAAPLA